MDYFQTFFIENQSELRLSSFIILILVFASLELIWPRKLADKYSKYRRLNNISLLLVNFVAARFLVPLATVEVALLASEQQFGLFNLISFPVILNIVLTVILFDLLIYLQHVIFHKFDFLWHVHRVHHSDIEFDVTTGIRFHPIEIVLSMFYKILAVYLIGPMAVSIVIYEILLNAAALFGHSNIKLKTRLDTFLRKVFVTPDMHRIHHSVLRKETDSNYGNIFSFWDKVFKTYRPLPEAGYDDMTIGLDKFREPSSGQVLQLLLNPFNKR